jgi:hypothetical protein
MREFFARTKGTISPLETQATAITLLGKSLLTTGWKTPELTPLLNFSKA